MSSRQSSKSPTTKSHSTSPSDVIARAEHGKEEILKLQEDLALAPALSPVVRKHVAIWTRFPINGLVQALDLHAKYGAKTAKFDASAVRDAIEYEKAVTPLLAAAKAFVRRLEDSVLSRRAAIGQQPLSLLYTLRGEVRYGDDSEAQSDLAAFEAALMPKKRGAPRKKKQAPSTPPPTAATSPAPLGATPALPGAATNDNAAPKGNGATAPAVDVSVRAS